MKLKFNYNVPDKYTGKEYVAGEAYEFKKERAEEILAVINNATGLPFAVVEETEEVVEITDMTLKQLKEIAEQMGIENFKNMKKDELIKAIEESSKEETEEVIEEDATE